MNKYKNKILVLLLIAFTPMVTAQIYVGGGIGEYSLYNNYEKLYLSNDLGFNLKAGYVKMFNRKFGVGIGAEYSQSKNYIVTDPRFSTETNLVDDVNSAFVYNVTTDGYREDQELSALQIPLFLQFKNKLNKNTSFYVRAGVKYFIPLKLNMTGTATRVSATGYYPDFNLLITDLPSRGFGTTFDYSESGEYETEYAIMLNLEFGFSFDVGSKSSIYTGVFLDRATQTIVKSENNLSFIGYNPTSTNNRKLNGLYNSNLDRELIPIHFGFTVSYSFGKH